MIMHRYCDSKMNRITMRSVIRERKFKRLTTSSFKTDNSISYSEKSNAK